MPIKTYHKLVRDRIPEIIEADGSDPTADISHADDTPVFPVQFMGRTPEIEQFVRTGVGAAFDETVVVECLLH